MKAIPVSILLLTACLAGCVDKPANPEGGAIPVSGPHPAYPRTLADKGIQGTVWYECDIDAAGYTHHCVIVSSTNHAFDKAVLMWAAATRFKAVEPARLPLHLRRHMNFTIASRS